MNFKGQGHSLNFVQGHSDSTFSILFCSETARPIEAKFLMEPPWDVGNENLFKCFRLHVHAHIHYGEKLQKYFSSEPWGQWLWNLVYSIGYSSTNNISYDDLGLTWLFLFYDRVIFVSKCFCMGESLYSIECYCISKFVLILHNSQHSCERYRTNSTLVLCKFASRICL